MKRTKKGRISFALSFELRDKIFRTLMVFLEYESTQLRRSDLANEGDVMRHLHYATLHDFFHKRNFSLYSTEEIKWTITRAEALALMWALRYSDEDLVLLQLKSGLHQILQ